MLKIYTIIYLLTSFFYTTLVADSIKCKEHINEKFIVIKKDNFNQHRLSIEIRENKSDYQELIVFLDGKCNSINDKLLAKSMKHDDVSAKAFQNIEITNNQLVLMLGTLRGNSYVEYKMFFSYQENEFILEHTIVQTSDFFTDDESVQIYYSKKKLSLSELSYNQHLIKDQIYNYLKKFESKISKKQPLYKSPDKTSKTKMYLIKGDRVEVLEEKDDWLHILYHGKKDIKAWIPKSSVKE